MFQSDFWAFLPRAVGANPIRGCCGCIPPMLCRCCADETVSLSRRRTAVWGFCACDTQTEASQPELELPTRYCACRAFSGLRLHVSPSRFSSPPPCVLCRGSSVWAWCQSKTNFIRRSHSPYRSRWTSVKELSPPKLPYQFFVNIDESTPRR